jgi:hypothetical protein
MKKEKSERKDSKALSCLESFFSDPISVKAV